MPSNHLIFCRPLLLLPSVFPSIRVFSSESALHIRWPKYWSFSISPSNEYSGLMSFRMDWFDLLAVQGTLKSFLQHRSSKASVLESSAFFMVQLFHLFTGKTFTNQHGFISKATWLKETNNVCVHTCVHPFTSGSMQAHYTGCCVKMGTHKWHNYKEM